MLRIEWVNGFQIEGRQHVECMPTNDVRQFLPGKPRRKQGLLIAGVTIHGHLLTRDRVPYSEVALTTLALQVRDRMFRQPTNQIQQRRQIDGGLQPARHLATEIGVNRPRRNGLPNSGTE